MDSISASFVFFFLLVLCVLSRTIDARKDQGEYWQSVMKDHTMPEAIQSLIHQKAKFYSQPEKTSAFHTTASLSGNKNDQILPEDLLHKKDTIEQVFVKGFEPRPNYSVYHDDKKLGGGTSFTKDFEPRPNYSVYHDDKKLGEGGTSFAKDFEPRPNYSVYNDDKKLGGGTSFAKDFEPRPNYSVYHDDKKLGEFEQRSKIFPSYDDSDLMLEKKNMQ